MSERQTLILTGLVTAVATSSIILTYQSLRREHKTQRLRKQVGKDVEEWEKNMEKSGIVTPEELAERHADGTWTPNHGRRVKEWKKGEFDEELIREQVG
jgi:hypothetical protein